MPTLQRYLSAIFNVVIHDPEDPNRLVPWRVLGAYALLGLCFLGITTVLIV